MIGQAGEEGVIDADALASAFAAQVLSTSGPITLEASCALGGVAVWAHDGPRGVLFVADLAPRAFSSDDLALIDEVGASLGRELARALPAAPVPLDAFVRMSEALIRDAGSTGAVAPGDYAAAAEHLSLLANRLRDLAATASAADRDALLLERESPPSQGHTATILLADDLDLNRKLISDMLTVEGHRVDCVADGAAAVAAVKAKSYDLILMDMIMPIMDGLTATRAIRALPNPMGRVPIVALTANTFREQLASCIEAGMNATVTKPMTFEALVNVVSDWTRGRTVAA